MEKEKMAQPDEIPKHTIEIKPLDNVHKQVMRHQATKLQSRL